MKNPFQARARQVPLNSEGTAFHTVRELSEYPVVPAGWPNRATRRAGKVMPTIKASVPYLAACLIARLSIGSVITVDSAGVARL